MIGVEVPQPADGVELLLAGDEGILFDKVGQRLFHLNPFASCIWCHVEEGGRIEAVAEATGRSMQLEPARARRFVLDMLEKWQQLGLLRGGNVPRPVVRDGQSADLWEPLAAPAIVQEITIKPERRQYQMLDTVFSFGFSDSSLEAAIHPVLAHLETCRDEPNPCPLDLVEAAGHIYLLQDGRVLGSCVARHGLAPLVQGIVGRLALRRYSYCMALHAAGLMAPEGVLLIAGRKGSGKTTLSAALLAAGWGYLSDDTILLHARTLDAVAVPYSLGIKAGSWPLLAGLYPSLDRMAIHRREDGEVIRYFCPPRENYALPRSVRWIAFPTRSANSRSTIRQLTQLEGLQRIFEHCCAIPRCLTHEDVRSLIQWSGGVGFFEMAVTDLGSATAHLHRIAADGHSHAASRSNLPLLADSLKPRRQSIL
jgi:coenzyme PQQ synthesis protein D (PqqD)